MYSTVFPQAAGKEERFPFSASFFSLLLSLSLSHFSLVRQHRGSVVALTKAVFVSSVIGWGPVTEKEISGDQLRDRLN
jgi:hypothetical protein